MANEGAAPGAYWNQTRRPLPCLIFLIPLLTLYEAGIVWIGGQNPDALRNGADFGMRWALEQVGLSLKYLLPLVIVLVFAFWHSWTREPWQLDGAVLLGMLSESLVLAVALMVIGRLQDLAFQKLESSGIVAALAIQPNQLQDLVCYLGAGIYEETLFRLLLLPAVLYTLVALGIPTRISMTVALTLSGLAFAGAHYIGPMAEPFIWFSFIFRWLAGLFFAGVFMLRGFGIAVGAHAAYDILVGVLQFRL